VGGPPSGRSAAFERAAGLHSPRGAPPTDQSEPHPFAGRLCLVGGPPSGRSSALERTADLHSPRGAPPTDQSERCPFCRLAFGGRPALGAKRCFERAASLHSPRGAPPTDRSEHCPFCRLAFGGRPALGAKLCFRAGGRPAFAAGRSVALEQAADLHSPRGEALLYSGRQTRIRRGARLPRIRANLALFAGWLLVGGHAAWRSVAFKQAADLHSPRGAPPTDRSEHCPFAGRLLVGGPPSGRSVAFSRRYV